MAHDISRPTAIKELQQELKPTFKRLAELTDLKQKTITVSRRRYKLGCSDTSEYVTLDISTQVGRFGTSKRATHLQATVGEFEPYENMLEESLKNLRGFLALKHLYDHRDAVAAGFEKRSRVGRRLARIPMGTAQQNAAKILGRNAGLG